VNYVNNSSKHKQFSDIVDKRLQMGVKCQQCKKIGCVVEEFVI